jgi:CBS domain-containing protein
VRNALLSHVQMSSVGVLPPRSTSTETRIQLSDAAVSAMNDFTREYPVTVDEERPINAAWADMIRLGVRALLVVQELKVVGFITSYDIEGERPIQYMQRSNITRRQDLQVGHIMTPWRDLVTLSWRAVKDARVVDLLQAFRDTRLMHLLVVETASEGTTCVRGLFSRTRMERQLGLAPAMTA